MSTSALPEIITASYAMTEVGSSPAVTEFSPKFPVYSSTILLGAALINNSGVDASATVAIQGLLDEDSNCWVTIGTFTLTKEAAETEAQGGIQAIVTPWIDYRAKVTAISGTGTSVKFCAIIKKSVLRASAGA